MSSDVLGSSASKNNVILKKETTPIVVVVPGLTSDSTAVYIKHLADSTAKQGWNVVVCNHRGMGGVPFTSDRTYNAGWTTDIRDVINYLHDEYPEAPLFAIGTSIGANILVKYLGEYGENVPLSGAAAICSPWDLLIGSRYMARRLVQNLYDMILTMVLQSYARVNQAHFTRLANWEGIIKARTISEFNEAATCATDKFETADTYYRWSSAAPYTEKVSIPLLVISALDDPVCSAESIPWHECRANKNIVLATTKHGGHLGFFEGITASGLWWVRAANEFLDVLHSTHHMDKQKKGQYSNVADANEPLVGQKFRKRNTTDRMASNREQLEHLSDSMPERVFDIVHNHQVCQVARYNNDAKNIRSAISTK